MTNNNSFNYNILLKRLFYIAPFYYKDSYDTVYSYLTKDGWSIKDNEGIECDLYEHIQNEMNGSDHSIGTILEKENNLHLIYGKEDKKTEIILKKSIIYLYKNSIGFYAYELEADTINDVDTLIKFQNRYKELSYATSALLLDTGKVDENNNIICKAILLGAWIKKQFEGLNVEFIPERKNTYKDILTSGLYTPFGYRLELDEQYLNIDEIPDKARCYTYCAIEESDSCSELTRREIAYYLSHAYKTSYKYNDDSINKPYSHFKNTYWSSSSEGCCYLATVSDDNRSNFISTLPSRMETSFFYLYVRALFESYSILKYSTEISNCISYDYSKYISGSEDKQIFEIFSKVNLFKTRVLSTAVSHVSNHVHYYSYIKQTLLINESLEELSSSLESLNDLQDMINSNRKDYFLGAISIVQAIGAIPAIFSILLIIFCINDANTITDLFTNNIFAAIIFVVSSLVIIIYPFIEMAKIKKHITTK